jgi:hypothetical protein
VAGELLNILVLMAVLNVSAQAILGILKMALGLGKMVTTLLIESLHPEVPAVITSLTVSVLFTLFVGLTNVILNGPAPLADAPFENDQANPTPVVDESLMLTVKGEQPLFIFIVKLGTGFAIVLNTVTMLSSLHPLRLVVTSLIRTLSFAFVMV